MRRAALLGVLATLGLSGCAEDSRSPATTSLRVRDDAGLRVVRTRAWPLDPGIVVALAARSDGRVVVAQRARVTVLDDATRRPSRSLAAATSGSVRRSSPRTTAPRCASASATR
jgi:uncharacterized lipoprotein YmbA